MRTLRRRAPAALLLVLLGLAAPSPGVACSCFAEYGAYKPCESYWGTRALFLGKAVSVAEKKMEKKGAEWPRRFRFEVVEGFIDVKGPSAEVWTGAGGGDCGYDFKIGETYLIFAGRGDDGRLHASICSPTRPAWDAKDAIAYARKVAGGTVLTSLYGQVGEARPDKFYPPGRGIPGIAVHFEGPAGQRFSVTTDASGSFEVEGKPPGEYTLSITVPEGLPAVEPQKVVLPPRECVGVLFEVAVPVADPEGLPG